VPRVTTERSPIDPIGAVALLEEPNRRRLYDLVVAGREAVGRDEAAAALAMSRELAAFHLDRLVEAGLLETEYRRRSGRTGPGAGRPAKLYRRADAEMADKGGSGIELDLDHVPQRLIVIGGIDTAEELCRRFARAGLTRADCVVAVGGDRIKVLAGRVYLNGRKQREPFINPSADCDICNLPQEITIPKGMYFMMGDNRGESADSRYWGPIPKKWIVGEAFMTYWPPGRIGGL